ncbi:unnamed protein product, partial [Acidithrix sp. C25]
VLTNISIPKPGEYFWLSRQNPICFSDQEGNAMVSQAYSWPYGLDDARRNCQGSLSLIVQTSRP